MLDSDQLTSAFWYKVTVGQMVEFSDPQALQDSVDEGRGAVPRNYEIKEIRTIEEQHGLATWRLFRVADQKQSLWLLAKIVDQQVELRLYFDLPENEFKPGNRRDMVERGCYWLFQQPADPQNFAFNDLEYTVQIPGPDGVVFVLKDQGVMAGTMTVTPPSIGMDGQLFTLVAEYAAPDGSTDNPQLLLLEIGGASPDPDENDNPDGGFITLAQGMVLNPAEVDMI